MNYQELLQPILGNFALTSEFTARMVEIFSKNGPSIPADSVDFVGGVLPKRGKSRSHWYW